MGKYGTFIFGALLGGLIGGVLGILLAPSSGNMTRQHIVDYSQKVTDDVRTAAKQRRAELEIELAKLRHPDPAQPPQ